MVNTTTQSIVKKMVDKRSIRVELDDKAEERFEAIKDFHGLKSDSEAVRFCISTTFNAMTEKRISPEEVPA